MTSAKRLFGVSTNYIEVEKSDVDSIMDIAKDILVQSLDEISPLCRDLKL